MVDDDTSLEPLMKRVANKNPDLLEVRIDNLRRHEKIERIAHRKPSPLITTDKSFRSPRSRFERLLFAAKAGTDYVDLDLTSTNASTVKQLQARGTQVIVSFHDTSRTPSGENLAKILKSEERLGGDVCKLVTTARSPRDNLTLLNFLAGKASRARLVAFAMGQKGIPSRILSPYFGAEFTFAALSSRSQTAEGQLTIDEIRSAWNILGI